MAIVHIESTPRHVGLAIKIWPEILKKTPRPWDAQLETAAQARARKKTVFIDDSKTPTGVAEVPLTDIALEAFRSQIELAGPGPRLFPSDDNRTGHQTEFKSAWRTALRRAGVPYFRLYDLRSTYSTRLSAGGVADVWVTQMLRQTDAPVFKKYSQMKLKMKRDVSTRFWAG